MEHSWERRASESPQAFRAFVTYRDGGDERSIQKVSDELGKSMALLCRWSSRHSWVKRAADYDRHNDNIATRELVKGKTQMLRRQIAAALNFQIRSANRIVNMTADEIAKLTPAMALAMFRDASKIEREVRTMSQEAAADSQEIKVQVNLFVPIEQIRARAKERGAQLPPELEEATA